MTSEHTRCTECEEKLQPYLDRVLSPEEHERAEAHLVDCADCGKRYRFEEKLRRYVREQCSESMPPRLKQRLLTISRTTRL